MIDKKLALEKIAQEIRICKSCKKGKIGLPVPGEGNPNADIIFLGEAPGKQESQTGRPFVGRSGKLLRKMIVEIGLREEDVFITSPVKYLPKYVTPKPDDIWHGLVHLEKQIETIDPKVIVLLGKTAAKAILGENIAVLEKRGDILKRKDRNIFITLHPAAVIRFPNKYLHLFKKDFLKLKKLIS